MGEVYRAHDPRMGRDVALKLSHEQFSERFDREVRAVAALSHPNICMIHDVGPNYLVMELVDGPTLLSSCGVYFADQFACHPGRKLPHLPAPTDTFPALSSGW